MTVVADWSGSSRRSRMVSERGRSPGWSCLRWSEPRIMIVCGLPASASVTSPTPSEGIVCPCSLITSERWATSSRIVADTATVVAPSTMMLPSRNFLYIRRACVRTGRRLERRSAAEAGQRAGDREHLLVRQRSQQRVRDPVDRVALAPGDQAQPRAVVVELVRPPVQGLRAVGLAQDRRVGPVHALDAVVVARLVETDHHAVGAVLAAVEVAQPVDARRLDVLAADGDVLRVVDRERRALRRED